MSHQSILNDFNNHGFPVRMLRGSVWHGSPKQTRDTFVRILTCSRIQWTPEGNAEQLIRIDPARCDGMSINDLTITFNSSKQIQQKLNEKKMERDWEKPTNDTKRLQSNSTTFHLSQRRRSENTCSRFNFKSTRTRAHPSSSVSPQIPETTTTTAANTTAANTKTNTTAANTTAANTTAANSTTTSSAATKFTWWVFSKW